MSIIENFIIGSFVTFSTVGIFLGIFYVVFNKVFSKEKIIRCLLSIMLLAPLGFYFEIYFNNNPIAGTIKIIYSLLTLIILTNKYLKVKIFNVFIGTIIYFFISNISFYIVSTVHSILRMSLVDVKNSFPKYFLTLLAMNIITFLY